MSEDNSEYGIEMSAYLSEIWKARSEMSRMQMYSGPPVDVEEDVWVQLFREEVGDASAKPVSNYIAELQALESPEGCQLMIEFEREGDYEDGHTVYREIGYWRKPTEEERAERIKRNELAAAYAAEREAAQEARDRETLAALKKKYEGTK